MELVKKRRLSLEEMERYSERDRLRAEEDRLLEQERLRQEGLEEIWATKNLTGWRYKSFKSKRNAFKSIFLKYQNVFFSISCFQYHFSSSSANEELQRREEEERLDQKDLDLLAIRACLKQKVFKIICVQTFPKSD